MPPLSVKTIEERVSNLANQEEYSDEILFDLLLAYGRSKSNNTRLRNGSLNVAADPSCEYAQKNVVYYRNIATAEPLGRDARELRLLQAAEELRKHERVVRFATRFVIVSDHQWFAVVDTKTNENRIFPIKEIDKHYAFFLPWAGMEKTQFTAEKHADTKAAEKMGKLFDALMTTNASSLSTEEERHALNIFFTRLLFCYFAEDTDLFPEALFTKTIGSQTREDGSDTAAVIEDIFAALDLSDKSDLPHHLQAFPYVNGRLFSANAAFTVPRFDKKSRQLLLELGRLMWQDINPDIFGSMFQAVVQSGSRSELGQHYTSVPNILKTIEPLFLDELKEEFDASYSSVPKLEKLLDRIGQIKIFDPACGSGNFLIIAYKELRRLEHAILDRLGVLSAKHSTLFSDSVIKIDNFFGIEIDDFASEVAILSLWITKHQMNREFKEKFGVDLPMIPLRSMGQIVTGNACRLDWEEVCPHTPAEEVYLIGNPPYVGSKKRTPEQTEDLELAFSGLKFSRNLDYISAWFIKSGIYIKGTKSKIAFVSTNSICQGEHVGLLFPIIFELGLEIAYAFTSFKWENNAKHNAGVTVVVLGLRNLCDAPRYLFSNNLKNQVGSINGYLIDGPNIFLSSRRLPLSYQLPRMAFGMMAFDGGNLLLDFEEFSKFTESNPNGRKFIKKFLGSNDFIKGIERYCLWVTEETLASAMSIPAISRKVQATKDHRQSLGTEDAIRLMKVPYRFREQHQPTESIIVPRVSSERREYVPIGFLGPDTVISDSAFAIYDAEPWLFALLTSKIHMVWLEAVGGKMKTDYRYSNTIVYNNFPVPHLTSTMKEKLTQTALRILDVREFFCEQTLAELYDKDKMPDLLRQAHADNDMLVDSIYRSSGFNADEDRLAALFKLYSKMTAEETREPKTKKKTKRKKTTNPDKEDAS